MTAKAIQKVVVRGIIVTGLLLLAIKTYFIGFYKIPQNGMYPGLPAGSRFFARQHPYSTAADVKRGDIIVFNREEDGQRYVYIWRVIALPGEKVESAGDSLTINGQTVQRQRLREVDGKILFREQIGDASYEVALESSPDHPLPPDVSIVVPAGQFFVMGDNRLDARDSRSFGPILFTSIIGKKL